MKKNILLLLRRTKQKIIQIIYSALALAAVILFALWWFNPSHIPHNFTGISSLFDIILFILVSYIIWHPIIMDILAWTVSSHIRDIRQQKPVPGFKVAFITTIVPKSEPVELLHKCLPAMVKAKYEHDTWLLDEGNNEDVIRICKFYGVKHFSRYGISEYNTHGGKFTKTKGGNHNSWYETYGNYYDFVAQVDTDFVPKRNFLTKTLGYFRDPKVAFVGTPQIYGNVKDSFIALGAAQQQFNFYGAVLRGLSGMGMNLLIGANHIIRVAAFKKVGHYTAHITEDLVTGMKLHADGYKSVYVPVPLAVGEGPSTWESYFNQQLRWAYGCIDILFHHSFKHFKKMGLRQSLYYFFLQQHYFSGLAMALSLILLILYFLFGFRAAAVDTFQFLVFYSLVLLICWLMSLWLQRYDVHRNREGKLYLAGKVISIAAGPIWFLGFLTVLTGKRLVYKVTPKGENESKVKISLGVFIPHIAFAIIGIMALISSFFTHRQTSVMLFWAFSSVALMLTVPFIENIAHALSKIYFKIYTYVQKTYFQTNTSEYALEGAHSFHASSKKSLKREGLSDYIFLGTVTLLSCILYVFKLGFYSDDWSFLGNFILSPNQSLIGLYQTATTPNTFMRPVQNLYDAVLFWLFGMQPLGYQLVNVIVFISVILLLYIILKQLQIPRIIAVTSALIYGLLPNYATDRFWYAAFQVNMSMLLFLLSTYAGLKAVSQKSTKIFLWKIISLSSLVISVLSYEVAIPLVLLNIILFWNPVEQFKRTKSSEKYSLQNHAVFITLNIIVLLYLAIFKIKTTTRLGSFNYPKDVIYLIISIFHTNFGTLGLKLPYIWGEIISQYANPSFLVATFILYLLIFFYLYFNISKEIFPSRRYLRNFTLMGIIIFLLGYAIFFTNDKVGFSPTGIDNRVTIVAAIGIAFTLVGALGWISRFLMPEKFLSWFFCVLIAILGAGGFLIINTLAFFWVSAYSQSQGILADIRYYFPNVPKHSTLILDGICPYSGPGIVFESQWDLKGALQTIYHDPTLQADIVTPRMKVINKDIATEIYTFQARYPYKNLFIFNFKQKKAYPILNENMANAYFQEFNPDYTNNCPPSSAGNGVTIF